MFQKTCKRVSADGFAPPIVIGNNEHRFLIGEQLAELEMQTNSILLEPVGRNTAPPALMAAMIAREADPDALVLLLPSDHLIQKEDVFRDAVRGAAPAARNGSIVTFGIAPTEPNTGYGYIKVEPGAEPVRKVEAFVEKPDHERAKAFLKDGNFVWNAGIFLYAADTMIEAFKTHQPELYEDVVAVMKTRHTDLDFVRLDQSAFEDLSDISIDYAIMEKADNVACAPIAPDWDDLGSWSAVWSVLEKDAEGNAGLGDARFLGARACLAYAERGLVSVIGLENVMVIATGDSVLVAHRDKAQDVKKIVDQLKEEGRDEVDRHPRSYRPWGYTERINEGDRFAVQSMMIKPGKHLSYQSHLHRAEHWVVVSGTVEITINGKTSLLTENQSAYVPLGANHRLHNPGRIPVRMIEIQSGTYLNEDDIVRHEDS